MSPEELRRIAKEAREEAAARQAEIAAKRAQRLEFEKERQARNMKRGAESRARIGREMIPALEAEMEAAARLGADSVEFRGIGPYYSSDPAHAVIKEYFDRKPGLRVFVKTHHGTDIDREGISRQVQDSYLGVSWADHGDQMRCSSPPAPKGSGCFSFLWVYIRHTLFL